MSSVRHPKLLLLIGTPGTGKRPLASYLERERGFVHVDFEHSATRRRFLARGNAALRSELAHVASGSRGVVITWAAGNTGQLDDVKRLRALGVQPVWFDSDRGAACQAHYAGARRPPNFRYVEAFEPDGTFRAVESVVGELLERPRRTLKLPRLAVNRTAADLRIGAVAIASGLAGAAVATALVLTGIGATQAKGHRTALAGGAAASSRVAVAPRHTPVKHVPALPRAGLLVSGESLAGVKLGDSKAKVEALWGRGFTVCGGCKPAMWLYLYPPPADPVGAGVEFRNGRVVAVFTLGGPSGWHTETGIRVGQILDNPTGATSDAGTWQTCAGYSAKSTRTTSDAVTSILTQGAAVYGFALTRPSVSPCH
jgi:hypothetical protein